MKNPKSSKEQRRQLRKEQTNAEERLWNSIRGRRLDGIKFRRQYGIENYILDFYTAEFKVAIEVDGGIHLKPEVLIKDRNRDQFLSECGIKVLRVTNQDIENDLSKVLMNIQKWCV